MRLSRLPLGRPDYLWVVPADLLVSGVRRTNDVQDYADRLTERLKFARYMLTNTGLELLVNASVVAGILDHQAEQGLDIVGQVWLEFGDGMAEVFAAQYTTISEAGFRRICVIAAARHVPALE